MELQTLQSLLLFMFINHVIHDVMRNTIEYSLKTVFITVK